MRDSAPAGFVDFVVARGSALHRTAVLLTRQEQAAQDLVQIALAKAWQSWARIDGNPEAYVRAIMDHTGASGCRPRTCPICPLSATTTTEMLCPPVSRSWRPW